MFKRKLVELSNAKSQPEKDELIRVLFETYGRGNTPPSPCPHINPLTCCARLQRATAKKRTKAKVEKVKGLKKAGKALKALAADAPRQAAAGKRRVGRPAKADSLGGGSVLKEKVAKQKEVNVVSPDGQGASKTFLHWSMRLTFFSKQLLRRRRHLPKTKVSRLCFRLRCMQMQSCRCLTRPRSSKIS